MSSNMNIYRPVAGTVPARAIEFLSGLEAGSKVSAPEIATAIDAAVNGISTCLAAAIKHGLIIKSGERHGTRYSLGKPASIAVPPSAADDDDDGAFQHSSVSASAVKPLAKLGPSSVFDLAVFSMGGATDGDRVATIARLAPSGTIACTLFNTGELRIKVAAQPSLRLSRAQARELVDFFGLLSLALEKATA